MTIRKALTVPAAALAMVALLAATPASADWHGGHGGRGHGHHGWSGGGVAAGIIGGLALGALAVGASRHAYAAPTYYDAPECYRDVRPVHDAWGRYMGERVVRVCD
jgi:hypothetical protein